MTWPGHELTAKKKEPIMDFTSLAIEPNKIDVCNKLFGRQFYFDRVFGPAFRQTDAHTQQSHRFVTNSAKSFN